VKRLAKPQTADAPAARTMQVVVRGEAGSDAPPAAERELERLPDAPLVERVGDRAPGASARQKQ